MLVMSTVLLLGTKLAVDHFKKHMPAPAAVPRCDACTRPLPERHAYTTCCETKLCDGCVAIYKERSPVRCCLCRTPH